MNKRDKIGNHNNNRQIDESHLLDYLDGIMSPEEEHRLEEILETDPFLRDAVEGLSSIKDKEQLRIIAAQINAQLKRQINNRKNQRHSRPRLKDHWGWIFVLILLLLLLLSWWVVTITVK